MGCEQNTTLEREDNMADETKDKARAELRAELARIKKGLRVTKVVCTRSIKGRYGDAYVGFSAAWDTIQDDAGGGADLVSAQDGDVAEANRASGMTLKESRMAALVLGLQADLAATDNAMAGSTITSEQRLGAQKAIKHIYASLMSEALSNGNGGN